MVKGDKMHIQLLGDKLKNLITFVLLFVISSGCSESQAPRDFYQIKIYNVGNVEQEFRIDEFLKEAFIPALHKTGITKIGVFKPTERDTTGALKIFVWIPFQSLAQYDELEQKLSEDPTFNKTAERYINAQHDNPSFVRIESILLRSFKDSPVFGSINHTSPKEKRVYELRSYEAATEKLLQLKIEMFNEGGESQIFKDLGFQPLFFGEVISGSKMPNLMYMSTFADTESQTKHWKSFRDAPEWLKLKTVKRYKNTVSHIDKYYLYPTDYSDI